MLTSVGSVAIENVRAGDMVWASDPETGEVALKEVVQTFRNETTELVHVTVNGEEIVCTNEHPFYCTTAFFHNPVLHKDARIKQRS